MSSDNGNVITSIFLGNLVSITYNLSLKHSHRSIIPDRSLPSLTTGPHIQAALFKEIY